MIPCFVPQTMTTAEMDRIHAAVLAILARTGMRIEHAGIRYLLCEHGAEPGGRDGCIVFPVPVVERFLATSELYDWEQVKPSVGCFVGVYQGAYLDPESEEMLPFTEERLAAYVKLARLLEPVRSVSFQNLPSAAATRTEPLRLLIFAWKHGGRVSGGITQPALSPYLLEMYEMRAAETGRPLRELFRGVTFLNSPLRLAANEAEEIWYFHQRGLRVDLTNMITCGGSGPVTLAGSLALNVAERIGIGMIKRALFGDTTWEIGGCIAPFDMRTLVRPYGRPEQVLADMAKRQLGRYYKVRAGAHTGLSDAKQPSFEAGVQKLMNALTAIYLGGGTIEAGLLSVDEVFSPIQMILDTELVTALRRVVRGFEVSDATLAVDLIHQVGPGGVFTGEEHTAAHFRGELWEPVTWAREMLEAWRAGDRKTDAERALDRWHALMAQPEFEPEIRPEFEARLWQVVHRAEDAFHH